jgi:NADP-dependent 3-hydroxy acid dehydrogenase YdfG
MSHGTALIVGVGPGLGVAIAKAFAEEGHPVALIARDADRLQRYVTEIAATGRTARAYQADAGDTAQLSSALTKAIDELGEPDVLIYNAAVLAPDKPTQLSADEWNARLTVNITGAKTATDTVLPHMHNGRGTLLFTGGGFALAPSPDFTAMSVGKAGLRAYVLALFQDQRAHGIHAATVTVAGDIGDGQPQFEPSALAARYLELHHQPSKRWTAEIIVD